MEVIYSELEAAAKTNPELKKTIESLKAEQQRIEEKNKKDLEEIKAKLEVVQKENKRAEYALEHVRKAFTECEDKKDEKIAQLSRDLKRTEYRVEHLVRSLNELDSKQPFTLH